MSHVYDACKWGTYENRRARKPHTCGACYETIEPRHVYRRWVATDDGDTLDVYLQCGRCAQLFDAIQDASDSRALIAFDLDCGESWRDTFGVDCPPHVEALAFAIQGELSP